MCTRPWILIFFLHFVPTIYPTTSDTPFGAIASNPCAEETNTCRPIESLPSTAAFISLKKDSFDDQKILHENSINSGSEPETEQDWKDYLPPSSPPSPTEADACGTCEASSSLYSGKTITSCIYTCTSSVSFSSCTVSGVSHQTVTMESCNMFTSSETSFASCATESGFVIAYTPGTSSSFTMMSTAFTNCGSVNGGIISAKSAGSVTIQSTNFTNCLSYSGLVVLECTGHIQMTAVRFNQSTSLYIPACIYTTASPATNTMEGLRFISSELKAERTLSASSSTSSSSLSSSHLPNGIVTSAGMDMRLAKSDTMKLQNIRTTLPQESSTLVDDNPETEGITHADAASIDKEKTQDDDKDTGPHDDGYSTPAWLTPLMIVLSFLVAIGLIILGCYWWHRWVRSLQRPGEEEERETVDVSSTVSPPQEQQLQPQYPQGYAQGYTQPNPQDNQQTAPNDNGKE